MFAENHDQIIEKTRQLYQRNKKTGVTENGFKYFYTCPDTKIYSHQWFWDSCFHIIVNSRLGNVDDAIAEMETLLYNQEEDGWIGHMNYWERKPSLIDSAIGIYYPDKKMSPIMQPAFIAHAMMYLYSALSETDEARALDVLKEFYPKIKKYYDVVSEKRMLWADRPLISIIHPWESGTDQIPAYDEVLGISGSLMPIKWGYQLLKTLRINSKCDWDTQKIKERDFFVVEDVLVNTVFADGLSLLSDLAKILGFDNDSKNLKSRAREMTDAIVSEMWSEEDAIFYNTSNAEHTQNRVKIVSSFFPLMLDNIPDKLVDSIITQSLSDPHAFNCNYPVPSVSISHPTFKPGSDMMLWRGPTWICTNWYIIKGLEHQMEEKPQLRDKIEPIYLRIKDSTIDLIKQFGFREYYNPFTGEGGGAKHFGWSALVVDLIE